MAANIVSNLFNVSNDLSISEDIKKQDFINIPQKSIEIKEYKSLSKEFLQDALSLLHTCNGYKGVDFEEIYINYSNFQDYHYEIMKNRHLVVIYDNDNKTFKYLTHSGKVFITSDIKVISIINNVPIPYKISFNYVPLLEAEKTKCLSLLTMVLFNIQTEDPLTLIKEYLKPSVSINDTNEYYINYYLYTIYPKIENLINKHNYWKYIHLEQEVYHISRKKNNNDLINYDYIKFVKEETLSKLKAISKEMKINLNSIYDDIKLLEEIYENTDYYLTLNQSLSNLLEMPNLSKLIDTINKMRFIKHLEENKALPIEIISNEFGSISSSRKIDITFNFTNKTLIRGHYKDLFYKIFAFLIHNKEYRNIISSDKSLIHELLNKTIKDKKELNINSFLLEHFIIGKLLGYNTDDEILLYFQNIVKTVITEEELLNTKNNYEGLVELKNLIDNYNKNNYKYSNPKLIYHKDCTPLGMAILDKIRLIQKHLIVEMDKYCLDFNKRNKANMDLIYFDENYIYILVDETALNTAFDTLTRVMPTIFSNYCPSIISNCVIEIID